MSNLGKLLSWTLLSCLLLQGCQTALYDDSQVGTAATAISSTTCNKNSVNDFSFSSSSALSCNGSNCSVSNPSLTTVTYLDATKTQRFYTLSSATVAQQNVISTLSYAFLFTFKDTTGAYTLYLAVPFDNTTTGNYSYQAINLNNITDSYFNSLKDFNSNPRSTLTSGLNLNAFNFLTTLNYNAFYSVMDSALSTTLLVSKAFLKLSSTSELTNLTSNPITFTGDYKNTADVLCWGQSSGGQFQTHMRQSIPLWFFLLAVMILWMYVLLSPENTSEVFERSFQNNKWTSWSLYSLFYLGHQEFFSRMSRGANMLTSVIWQAMVVSALYSIYWDQNGNAIIIWAAVIGWAASIPIPYFMGNIFLKKIYQLESERMQKKIDEHHEVDKTKREILERDAILLGEDVYSYNYWYYSTIMIMLAVFGILSVHSMQSVPSLNYYYRNFQWLISMGIIIGWQNLILDPILTACFGDKEWYQNRGYYYNSDLGELYRKAD